MRQLTSRRTFFYGWPHSRRRKKIYPNIGGIKSQILLTWTRLPIPSARHFDRFGRFYRSGAASTRGRWVQYQRWSALRRCGAATRGGHVPPMLGSAPSAARFMRSGYRSLVAVATVLLEQPDHLPENPMQTRIGYRESRAPHRKAARARWRNASPFYDRGEKIEAINTDQSPALSGGSQGATSCLENHGLTLMPARASRPWHTVFRRSPENNNVGQGWVNTSVLRFPCDTCEKFLVVHGGIFPH